MIHGLAITNRCGRTLILSNAYSLPPNRGSGFPTDHIVLLADVTGQMQPVVWQRPFIPVL